MADGFLLDEGILADSVYVSLQAESHPAGFREAELLGPDYETFGWCCMDSELSGRFWHQVKEDNKA